MLWTMFLITVSLIVAGCGLRDWIRSPNWTDAIVFVIFLCCGGFYQLVLIGKILEDTRILTHV